MTVDPRPVAGRWSRLLVTRPLAEAGPWVQVLQGQGWPAQALPLIDIVPPQAPADRAALAAHRARWLAWSAIMFVSAAAVQHFFSSGVPAAEVAIPGTRFWAPGPGTARALAEALARHGVAPTCIDSPPADAAQFDSEHLWPVVADQVGPGHRLLVVRGASNRSTAGRGEGWAGSGRDWLLQRCQSAGSMVQACAAYERHAPRWTPDLCDQAEAGAAPGSLWLFSSSEALSHLRTALPHIRWSAAAALCTHDRIASMAREAGFGDVVASRPALDDVLRSLESTRNPP